MKWIAIDTSTEHLSLGISEGEQILFTEKIFLERRHSTDLLPILQETLKHLGLSIQKMDGFIVGLGPGSFTGLRVGISMVKAMAICLQKPIVGVPTLDCLAGAVLGGGIQVVPFIDAKRNQVYAALYERKNGVLRKKIRERVTPPHSFLKTVRGKTLFLGDGAVLYKDMIRGMLGKRAVLADPAYHVPNPATLVAIGVDRFTKGRLENPYKLIPLYLYPKDCMINKDHLAKVKKLPKAKD